MNIRLGLVTTVLTVFESVLSSNFGSLDLFELDKVQYGVFISGQPVALEEGLPESSLVAITNKYGQKYHCKLPEVENPNQEGLGDDNKDSVTSMADFMALIKTALSPMTSSCLIKTKDWWTYEVCPGKMIKQYHMEGKRRLSRYMTSLIIFYCIDGKPKGKVLNLGEFNNDQDWTESERSSEIRPKHHVQHYTNGTVRNESFDISQVYFILSRSAI